VTWLRSVLAHFGHQLPTRPPELDLTKAKHDRVIEKADRVIEDYRRQDGTIRILWERK
jgi:hypothetical protein